MIGVVLMAVAVRTPAPVAVAVGATGSLGTWAGWLGAAAVSRARACATRCGAGRCPAFVVVGSLYTPAMALLSDGAAAAGLAQGMAFALVNLVWAGGQVVGAVAGSGIAEATSQAVTWLVLAVLLGAAFATALAARRAPVVTV